MCHADVGVFGQVWYRADPNTEIAPFVDFNTKHTCRNYDDIRRWAEERQLPEDVPDDFLRPPFEDTVIIAGVP
jgi:Mycotoxin biosynthesis protein UstYa